MTDPVRATVEHDEEATSVLTDDEATVSAGNATVRFSMGSGDDDDENDPRCDAEDNTAADADPCQIASVEAVPADSTLRFSAQSDGRGVDCILRRSGDAVVAWRNSCPHQPEVPLDPGSGAIVRRGDLVCHKHGAQFAGGDGVCTHGPCAGDALDSIAVAVRDGAVYLTDERFDAARRL
jgi:nitrite reductase/ring-hydroxylating ferredoxin subunit